VGARSMLEAECKARPSTATWGSPTFRVAQVRRPRWLYKRRRYQLSARTKTYLVSVRQWPSGHQCNWKSCTRCGHMR
jgi:hypothetical protein